MGPTLLAILVAESPLIQPHLYDLQIPPVVFLSGVLMFVAGHAVVRAHKVWAHNWTVLVTLAGWFFLILRLVRMFAAEQHRQAAVALVVGSGSAELAVRALPVLRSVALGFTDLGSRLGLLMLMLAFAGTGYVVPRWLRSHRPFLWLLALGLVCHAILNGSRALDVQQCMKIPQQSFCGLLLLICLAPIVGVTLGYAIRRVLHRRGATTRSG